MALRDTKQKILDASLHLFNENGITNVRLQQIADLTGISIGNLAYHFNNKEAITESLIGNVLQSLQEILKQYGKHESLIDLNSFFKEFYRLTTQYRFFNIDILEIKRNFPSSYESLNPLLHKSKMQLERRFELLVQQQLLQKETNIKNLVSTIWLLIFFMLAEDQVNGKSLTENLYRLRLWESILLYFTAKGKDEYSLQIEPELIEK